MVIWSGLRDLKALEGGILANEPTVVLTDAAFSPQLDLSAALPTMAFKNGLSERLDELRFPSPRSPPSESVFPGYTSLSPGHSNFGSGFSRPSGDVRANLQRRFTTDSSKLSSSWNYLSPGSTQLPDPLDLLSSVCLMFQSRSIPLHFCFIVPKYRRSA